MTIAGLVQRRFEIRHLHRQSIHTDENRRAVIDLERRVGDRSRNQLVGVNQQAETDVGKQQSDGSLSLQFGWRLGGKVGTAQDSCGSVPSEDVDVLATRDNVVGVSVDRVVAANQISLG